MMGAGMQGQAMMTKASMQTTMVEIGESKQVKTSDDGGSRWEQMAMAKVGGNKAPMVEAMMKEVTKYP